MLPIDEQKDQFSKYNYRLKNDPRRKKLLLSVCEEMLREIKNY